ncbi:MAG: hypothetical protein SFV51_15790 [Bryobacteraceae bacterium]|nr:hypothetical protein [Bryobacteraceae bacterium]
MRYLALLLACMPLAAQRQVTHEQRPGLALSSGKVELVVLKQGGAFVEFTLSDDPKRINPMWDPIRMAREKGAQQRFGASAGHFVCVDGFGPISPEEQKAGYQSHGEANKLPWDTVQSTGMLLTQAVNLPIVHERYERTVRMAAGEQVVQVSAAIRSQLAFDRPMLWAEHGTIGAPFLKLGRTVVDQSTKQCQTKPFSGPSRGNRTFPNAKNFIWPELPLDGTNLNLRVAPEQHGTMNHIGCLFDPDRATAFVTALNLDENLLIGYLMPRQDYPWIQHWMNYPENGTYSWGIEFGMQPYDMTKRDLYAMTPLFGADTFRWLPANSQVLTTYLMFLTRVPAGFQKVDDVRLEGGQLVIEDKKNGKRVALKSTYGLEH